MKNLLLVFLDGDLAEVQFSFFALFMEIHLFQSRVTLLVFLMAMSSKCKFLFVLFMEFDFVQIKENYS